MHESDSQLVLSPTDLSTHAECAYRTVLDLAAMFGKLTRPGDNAIERRMLEKRGREHEQRVLDRYRSSGLEIVSISAAPGGGELSRRALAEETLSALNAGADIVYQGVLFNGTWFGRPDFLVRVDKPSRFGDHSYEVVDAKLAREAKARAVVQLCAYTDQLSDLQGVLPEKFHIVPGGQSESTVPLRVADYMAFYRHSKLRFEAFVKDRTRKEPYPEPVEHCDVCSWWKYCEDRRRRDDHLSLVAGITRRQRERLEHAQVARLAELAQLAATRTVEGIAAPTLQRVRDQARLQYQARGAHATLSELITDAEDGTGLTLLPAPSPGDLFLDLEGDMFVAGLGLEYLFGLLELGGDPDPFSFDLNPNPEPRYHAFWATNLREEKRAFEEAVKRILERRETFPGLHVYHYGHRDVDALKRLACRYRLLENEIDTLLREHVFVDLHRITKQAIRASVEAYGLKQLEPLYKFERRIEPRKASAAMLQFSWWLESAEAEQSEAELRETIERYNEEDCYSAWRLRDFLITKRSELARLTGRVLSWREPEPAKERKEDASPETAQLILELTSDLPEDPDFDNDEQRARRLMADLLDWHAREAKSVWWEYFRTLELAPGEHTEDRSALGGLTYVGVVEERGQSLVHRYEFPLQEHALRASHGAIDPDTGKTVKIVGLGAEHVDIARGKRAAIIHPRALIPGKPIQTGAQRARLLELGRALAGADRNARDRFKCALDVLLRRKPRTTSANETLVQAGETPNQAIKRLALELDESVLAVQGPPGSGKTHCAAEMILELVKSGRRVGVTASSHEVILSVLRKTREFAEVAGVNLRVLHIGDDDKLDVEQIPFPVRNDYDKISAELRSHDFDLIGGTAWAWAREEFAAALDVLVVDEAGQMSLANVLAVATSSKNLILFGDPAQLDQPQKGVHPPGADASALEHILGEAKTMPAERGVFLPHTRRLHPVICDFTSELFYEGRLEPISGLEHQRIVAPSPFSGSGLRFIEVEHRGNTNRCEEEVALIAQSAERLLSGSKFIDREQRERALDERDILVIAPYNQQVSALRRKLPKGVQVGTVDKFQGKQAPVVFYSLTSSSAEDAPRGLEFLYSLNRLNVATSRAQALIILVGSPELTRARCRTPRQIQLVNALCRYLELAERLSLE